MAHPYPDTNDPQPGRASGASPDCEGGRRERPALSRRPGDDGGRPREDGPSLAGRARPRPLRLADARCGCGHVAAAHAGRLDASGLTRWPEACAVMICGCEVFRGEADR